jgi:pimeloyl-ACP methyl ester carboxylesterase
MDTWLIILLLVVGIALAGLVFQAVATAHDRRRYPPPGVRVDVGGYRIHLVVMGDRSQRPVVVLDAGMVSASPNWAWVQPEVAKTTCVVAYDRAGLGWSDPGPGPRDAGQNAGELRRALQAAGLPGPYMLAGHSYGGLVAQAFAALYRADVAGLVLVDASHPDQWAHMGVPSSTVAMGNKVSGFLARFGLFRLFPGEFDLLVRGLPSPQKEQLKFLSSTPVALATGGQAAAAWDAISRPLVNQAGGLGDLPLVVLSVTDQPRMGEKLTELQNRLPGLSSRSQHITVQGAYHEGLVSQPQHAEVVTQAILEIVEQCRT